jgi:hypothetical protein
MNHVQLAGNSVNFSDEAIFHFFPTFLVFHNMADALAADIDEWLLRRSSRTVETPSYRKRSSAGEIWSHYFVAETFNDHIPHEDLILPGCYTASPSFGHSVRVKEDLIIAVNEQLCSNGSESENGIDWAIIANKMGLKYRKAFSARECFMFYKNAVAPSINVYEWTADEDRYEVWAKVDAELCCRPVQHLGSVYPLFSSNFLYRHSFAMCSQ